MVKVASCIFIRANSKRFRNKCYVQIAGSNCLKRIFSSLINNNISRHDIYLLTSTDSSADRLIQQAKSLNINYLRGPEEYPILRISNYLPLLIQREYTHFGRICGDSPLYPGYLYHKCITILNSNKEYKSFSLENTLPKTFPNGMSIEIYDLKTVKDLLYKHPELLYHDSLTDVLKLCKSRIHLSTTCDYDRQSPRLTLDYPEDVKLLTDNIYDQDLNNLLYKLMNETHFTLDNINE